MLRVSWPFDLKIDTDLSAVAELIPMSISTCDDTVADTHDRPPERRALLDVPRLPDRLTAGGAGALPAGACSRRGEWLRLG